MFTKIIDPFSKQYYKTSSKKGIQLLTQFIKAYQKGGELKINNTSKFLNEMKQLFKKQFPKFKKKNMLKGGAMTQYRSRRGRRDDDDDPRRNKLPKNCCGVVSTSGLIAIIGTLLKTLAELVVVVVWVVGISMTDV